jgi:hypothetical protein
MNLPDYIKKIGTAEFSRKFGVSVSAAAMYRRRERMPRPDIAQKIVAQSPVTWDAIYGKADKGSN